MTGELRFMQVIAVHVYGLIPRGYEVLHEDLLRIGRCIDFRDGPELRVETEDQVHTRGGPLDLTCPAIQPLKQAFRSRRCLPVGRHVEQVELSSAWGVWRSRADALLKATFSVVL